MTDTHLDVDFGALRRKVRAAQHTRSMPLIILGALLVNYGVVSFAASPVPFRFGAPLAFVAVAVALRLNESRTGVGTARWGDYLVAGAFVFMATNIAQLYDLGYTLLLGNHNRLPGAWTIIVALALLGVALTVSDWLLMLASALIGAVGAMIWITPGPWAGYLRLHREGMWQSSFVALLGALLVLAGIIAYRFERAAS